jgi:hypothetical protein
MKVTQSFSSKRHASKNCRSSFEQLRRAIEAVNGKVDFDIDPFDFRAALLDVATGSKDD